MSIKGFDNPIRKLHVFALSLLNPAGFISSKGLEMDYGLKWSCNNQASLKTGVEIALPVYLFHVVDIQAVAINLDRTSAILRDMVMSINAPSVTVLTRLKYRKRLI